MFKDKPTGLQVLIVLQILIFAGTIIGYGSTEVIPGLLGQFFLGVTQVASGIVFFIMKKQLTTASNKKMQTYGGIVFAYFIGALIILSMDGMDIFDGKTLSIIGGIIIPLVIAVYYIIILNKLEFLPRLKEKKQTYNADILDN